MSYYPLYTIGHGNRKAEDFLRLLQKYDISYLVDVRSVPYSRFNPQYNQPSLKSFLENNNIQYVFMGNELGGRPQDPGCYDDEGHIDYSKVIQKDFFRKGIERLKTASEKKLALAFMCSESNPADCHRTRMIGIVLNAEGIPLKHIDKTGEIKNQETVMAEIKNMKRPGKTNIKE